MVGTVKARRSKRWGWNDQTASGPEKMTWSPWISVRVADEKSTSLTRALHFGLGQASALVTVGVAVTTVKVARPFVGSMPDTVPLASTSLSWPGATLAAGLVHSTVAMPVAFTVAVRSSLPRPDTLPETRSWVPMSVAVGPE